MHFKLTVKFEIEWIMIMKFNIAIFVFTEKNQVITLGHHRHVCMMKYSIINILGFLTII